MSVASERKFVALMATAYFLTTGIPACLKSSSYLGTWLAATAASW